MAEGDSEKSKDKPEIPLKAMIRPNKSEFDAKIIALNNEVQDFNDRLSEVDAKIAEAKSSGGDQSEELREARATMKSLRDRKDSILRDRAEIATLQKSARASLDSKITAGRSLRAELKYTSPDDIDKRIAQLEKQQSTTSMSLKDEKVLLKEIEQLKQSRKLVTHLAANNDSISSERKNSQSITEQLNAKNAELDILKKKIDEQKSILETLNEANSERRAVLPGLYKDKDVLRREKQAKVEVIKSLRADFRLLENDFRAHLREVRRIRNEARKAEDEARRLELEKQQKEAEEEELKRVPYEEEMELCTYLANYLQTTYCKGGADHKLTNMEPRAGAFEGLRLSGKNASNDDEDDYLSLNKATGRKKGRGKKKGGLKVSDKILLVPETIEIFGLLGLEPPATVSGVVVAIQNLLEKKTWFSTLERGALPSIRDKQRAQESKQRTKRDRHDNRTSRDNMTDARDQDKNTKGKGFNAADLASAEDAFPSLPGATS
mmetsp:Transcript_1152/g.3440  ORF Transcript_1152/g.3440 Transcript_1152/m.3440 type:complete len:492 (+) Transcript_1152:139-1614(+)|eukprot:CAMPEP_0119259710 /NCGR_PEP_ID=MMETSP1329-20130426/420_1 /TAXON_ID=114041 /ORGANISM="Genus nov. species nov., Strain RCC1024" /LENGTH=491 /DNA_ID=CAMNT_0007259109 /DNA_START=113 /DNA_END=1588 /DNA_ORIENTATION=-